MPTFEEELQQALGGGKPSFEDELSSALGGDMGFDDPYSPAFSNREGGPTLEEIDTQRVADEQGSFRSISDPERELGSRRVAVTPRGAQFGSTGRAQWSGDALDTLADGTVHAANGMFFGYGDELAGLVGGDEMRDNIRNRLQLGHERSPGASLAGDVVGGAVPAVASTLATGGGAALPMAGRVALGMGLGAEQAGLAASGNADDGDRWEAALDAAPIGAGMGALGELGASGVQGAGNWARNTAAPYLRNQGLLNRAASTAVPPKQLMNELGGPQGMREAGQWMEDRGMTQWSPRELQSNIDDYTSMRSGDQRSFLDELGENPDAYPVDTSGVSDDLLNRAGSKEGYAAQNAQSQSGQYLDAASRLEDASGGGAMPFEDAWKQRQEFDQGARWNQGENGDQGLAAVNRDAAGGLRGAMGDALDNTAPGLRPRWESIQGDISTGLALSGGGDAATARSLGSAPTPANLRSATAAAAGGPAGYAAGMLTQMGGRGMMADAYGGASSALDSLASRPGSDAVRGMSMAGAGQMGRGVGQGSLNPRSGGRQASMMSGGTEDVQDTSRGYLLPDAAFQMMQQPGALGPYESQFWEAYKSPDSHAVSALIVRLSNTDPQFKSTYLKQMQALTAAGEGY